MQQKSPPKGGVNPPEADKYQATVKPAPPLIGAGRIKAANLDISAAQIDTDKYLAHFSYLVQDSAKCKVKSVKLRTSNHSGIPHVVSYFRHAKLSVLRSSYFQPS